MRVLILSTEASIKYRKKAPMKEIVKEQQSAKRKRVLAKGSLPKVIEGKVFPFIKPWLTREREHVRRVGH